MKINLRDDLVTDYSNRYEIGNLNESLTDKNTDKRVYMKRLANFRHCRTNETPLVSFQSAFEC